jgi:hypothetical protein
VCGGPARMGRWPVLESYETRGRTLSTSEIRVET